LFLDEGQNVVCNPSEGFVMKDGLPNAAS